MVVETRILPFHYVERPWAARVEHVCRGWAGTPYKLNGCLRGRYVDCIHLGAAVLDELFGTAHSKNLQSLPPDACVHNRRGVQKALRWLLRCYPCARVRDGSLEAGDLVVFGHASQSSGPSHLLIASVRGVLWEAARPRVRAIGYGISQLERLLAVYRVENKHLWSS